MTFDLTKFGSCNVGRNSTISCDVAVENILRRIHIRAGDNCFIKLEGIVELNSELKIHMNQDCSLSIGKGQRINGNVQLYMHEPSSIQIGDDCLWSDTKVWTSDMHKVIDVSSATRTNLAEDIVIGNRVWFGYDSLVLKGANIGNDTVVGARSVVMRGTYMNNIILGGYPAKEVKSGIVWS